MASRAPVSAMSTLVVATVAMACTAALVLAPQPSIAATVYSPVSATATDPASTRLRRASAHARHYLQALTGERVTLVLDGDDDSATLAHAFAQDPDGGIIVAPSDSRALRALATSPRLDGALASGDADFNLELDALRAELDAAHTDATAATRGSGSHIVRGGSLQLRSAEETASFHPVAAPTTRGPGHGRVYPTRAQLEPRAAAVGTPSASAVPVVLCSGATATDAGYAVYTLFETEGFRFRLSHDVFPDRTAAGFKAPTPLEATTRFSQLSLLMTPAVAMRGMQPFHDFSEGPDWWRAVEYKLHLEQIGKAKGNFIGLHTYPLREPTVWTGLDGQFDPSDGTVKTSYSTTYMTTLGYESNPKGGGDWGGIAMNTSDYVFGADQVFPRDCYSSDAQLPYDGTCPIPSTPEQDNAVFNRVADTLDSSFTYGRDVFGTQTCVGTEVPLAIPAPAPAPTTGPAPLMTFWSQTRRDHFVTATNCEECAGVYEFVRVEGWVMAQNDSSHTVPLSTCYSGQLQDNILVKGTSCPSGYGHVRVEGYARPVSSDASAAPASPRDTTALMVFDAPSGNTDHWALASAASIADAKAAGYSPDSAMGTLATLDATGPAPPYPLKSTQEYYEGVFKRIAAAYPIDVYWMWTPEGWEWSKVNTTNPLVANAVADLKAAQAAHAAVNASFELATCGWVLGPLGDRAYLDSVVPDSWALSSIDMDVGWAPVDPAYGTIKNHKAWQISWMEDDPGLASLQLWVNRTLDHSASAVAMGAAGTLGIHWRTRAVSLQFAALAAYPWITPSADGGPAITSRDFFQDVAETEFGMSGRAAEEMASLLDSIDSFELPRQAPPRGSDTRLPFSGCPGVLAPNPMPWTQLEPDYAFVDRYLSFAGNITGYENRDRYHYWASMLQYLRQQARVGCDWHTLEAAMTTCAEDPDPASRKSCAQTQALPAYTQLVQSTAQLFAYQLNTTSTTGSMGTLANLEQHLIPTMVSAYEANLTAYLQGPIPAASRPSKAYTGATRLTVQSPRATFSLTEPDFPITALVLSGDEQPQYVAVKYMRSGKSKTEQLSLVHVRGGHYSGALAAADFAGDDVTWYVEASWSKTRALYWPPGAPAVNFTTVAV